METFDRPTVVAIVAILRQILLLLRATSPLSLPLIPSVLQISEHCRNRLLTHYSYRIAEEEIEENLSFSRTSSRTINTSITTINATSHTDSGSLSHHNGMDGMPQSPQLRMSPSCSSELTTYRSPLHDSQKPNESSPVAKSSSPVKRSSPSLSPILDFTISDPDCSFFLSPVSPGVMPGCETPVANSTLSLNSTDSTILAPESTVIEDLPVSPLEPVLDALLSSTQPSLDTISIEDAEQRTPSPVIDLGFLMWINEIATRLPLSEQRPFLDYYTQLSHFPRQLILSRLRSFLARHRISLDDQEDDLQSDHNYDVSEHSLAEHMEFPQGILEEPQILDPNAPAEYRFDKLDVDWNRLHQHHPLPPRLSSIKATFVTFTKFRPCVVKKPRPLSPHLRLHVIAHIEALLAADIIELSPRSPFTFHCFPVPKSSEKIRLVVDLVL